MEILNSPLITLVILVADAVLLWIFVKDYRALKRVNQQLDRMEANAKEMEHLFLRKKPDPVDPNDDTIPF